MPSKLQGQVLLISFFSSFSSSFYLRIASILVSSSSVKPEFSSAFTFSSIWESLLAPRITDVSFPFSRAQTSAICARDCPLSPAISFRLRTLSSCSFVILSAFKNWLCPAARESSGIPFKYLPVSIPCSNGQNTADSFFFHHGNQAFRLPEKHGIMMLMNQTPYPHGFQHKGRFL